MNDRELDKNAARRLAIIRHAREVTGNAAMTCRYYGISRQVFYTWYRRYETEDLAGLRDRSRRPQYCPHETPAEVVAKIIYLRQNYHSARRRSPCTSSATTMCRSASPGCGASSSGWTSAACPPRSATNGTTRKWKRYEKPMPGHAVQVDVKFIAPLSSSSRKKYYQFTAIDDCTRLRVLRIYDRLNQKTAIQFADFLPDKFPVRVEVIQTDTGPSFSQRSTGTCWIVASGMSIPSPQRRG